MKKTVEYSWSSDVPGRDINDWLAPSRSEKHGCPMKKFLAFSNKVKNAFDDQFVMHNKILNGEEVNYDASSTLRLCTGVNDLFSRSLVYTAPTDIAVTYTSDHTILSSTAEEGASFKIIKHSLDQTEYSDGSGNLLDDRVALKFMPPIVLNSPCDILFMNPTWHGPYTPWRVMSGIVKKGIMQPNLFLEVPIIDDINHLEIKKGDPLAYLYFTCDVNLSLKEKDFRMPPRKKFLRGY